jgi:uncharacterized protein (TIGR02118 family)
MSAVGLGEWNVARSVRAGVSAGISRCRLLGAAAALAAGLTSRASADGVEVGMRAYTAGFPGGAGIDFDHAYYRDRHMSLLIELFGPEAIGRIEMRKGLASSDGAVPPRYACTVNIYVANQQAFAAAAGRSHRSVVDDILNFTSVASISVMTEVFGAFGA